MQSIIRFPSFSTLITYDVAPFDEGVRVIVSLRSYQYWFFESITFVGFELASAEPLPPIKEYTYDIPLLPFK